MQNLLTNLLQFCKFFTRASCKSISNFRLACVSDHACGSNMMYEGVDKEMVLELNELNELGDFVS